MQYGICPLSIVPLRLAPSDESEMVSQLLYGEHFKILEERAKWSRIRVAFDACEAWVRNKQIHRIEEQSYIKINSEAPLLTADLIEFVVNENQQLTPVPMGSQLNANFCLRNTFDGHTVSGISAKENIVKTALFYQNSPHLWGGKSPLGIDCSGFTQMVYKLNGYKLQRNACDQAKQGEALSFIEESEAGDLVFFDDNEGIINHVGIMMQDNYIIHVDEKVRIDRIDHSGIFNTELRRHTHKLRVIKKVI
ncbi:C40 family peptidase [Zunongwangia sp. HRR-M8]|uniref:C40 family peptidase n=1 Tax=Zunongwangia sp. HRR-M8 TaxID=3015170 RepID=UPI0022DD7A7A|nr:C40 family peptidase [Zunongwangia sp. HRR-M8]WBL23922.1 C40 family peptidase [Zunongwangia sp. HRR-M8]